MAVNNKTISFDIGYQKYLADKKKAEQDKQLIMTKSNIGGWFFDAVIKSEHTFNMKITDFPVATGASLTDHAYVQPSILIMDIAMSDIAKSIKPGQFAGGKSRSITAFEVLLSLQQQRVPLQVYTRLRMYQNMLIESIVAPDDMMTMYGLKATVTLREIQVASIKTVKLSARPGSTNKTKKGKAEPINPNQSVLKQATDLLKGKSKKKGK